jgi:Na+/proline symporter
MDEEFAPRPIAGWYMIAAVVSLLLTGLFCILYLMHVMADPASMPLDQRAAYDAMPAWVLGAFGLGAWAGLAGGILLVLKRKQAEIAMLVSLAGMLVWLAGSLVVAPLREAMSATDLLLIIVLVAIDWTIFWFARHSRMRGWLR